MNKQNREDGTAPPMNPPVEHIPVGGMTTAPAVRKIERYKGGARKGKTST